MANYDLQTRHQGNDLMTFLGASDELIWSAVKSRSSIGKTSEDISS